MQKVRQQHHVVRPLEVHFERAARQHVVAVLHACFLRILQCYAQHRRPIQACHMRLRILFRNLNPEQPVTGRDIQHAHRPVVSFQDHRAQRTRHRSHHRPHRLGKLHPDWILRLHAACAFKCRPSGPHHLSQMLVRPIDRRVADKLRNRRQARG